MQTRRPRCYAEKGFRVRSRDAFIDDVVAVHGDPKASALQRVPQLEEHPSLRGVGNVTIEGREARIQYGR